VLYPWLSDWTPLHSAMGIAQLEAHEAGESILCMTGGCATLTNYFGGTG